jgi:Tol biopolymer transport system component
MDFGRGRPALQIYSAVDRSLKPFANICSEARFSPDGKWIVFTFGGPGEIFAQPFPGPSGRIQISSAGGAQARWSRDGKQIFYIQPDKKLMEV